MTEEFRRRGRFDENKVKRNRGRFAKKVGKALLKAAAPEVERAKNTPSAQVFARHGDGDVTHVSDDGNSRLVYDASTRGYQKQEKQQDGSWQTTESVGKLAAFKETRTGWRMAREGDDGSGDRAVPDDDAPADTPTTPAPSPAPTAPPVQAPDPVAPDASAPDTSGGFLPVDPAYPLRTPEDMAQTATRTPEQIAAMHNYSVTQYRNMNGCLRTGTGCDPDTQARNAELESAMTPTTEAATVFRAMTLANLAGGIQASDLDSLVGGEISDPGFTSTSLDRAQTEIFGAEQDSVDLQIEMPAGTRAVVPGNDAALPEEQEVILPPGTRYRVVEASNPPPPGRPSLRIQVIP